METGTTEKHTDGHTRYTQDDLPICTRADAYAGGQKRGSRQGVACHQSVIAAFCSIKGIEILIAAVDSRGFARRGVDARADEGGKAAIFCRSQHDRADDRAGPRRSDEHTSELQSLMRLSSAVFCLTTTQQMQLYTCMISSIFLT